MKKREQSLLSVVMITPRSVLFEGKASSVILPGKLGTFEIQAFHKPLCSRLLGGNVVIDGKRHLVKSGAVRVSGNIVTILAESGGE